MDSGRLLNLVERDFDDELGTDVDGEASRPVWSASRVGLPGQQLVGQPLERLAEHREAARLRVARAEVQVAEPPSPASVAPSAASTTRSSVRAGLTLSHAVPRRPAAYGASSAFDHHALVAGARGVERGLRAASASSAIARRIRCASGTTRVERRAALGTAARRAGPPHRGFRAARCSSPPDTVSSVRPYPLVPAWATVPPRACAIA